MENRINVNQPGGMIQIDIKEDGTIFMTGTVGYIAEMSVAEAFSHRKKIWCMAHPNGRVCVAKRLF